MFDLIKVNYDSDRPTVLGRDLHKFLEIRTEYKDWFPRMLEYGFEKGLDYSVFYTLKNEHTVFTEYVNY